MKDALIRSDAVRATGRHVEAASCWVCSWVAGPKVDEEGVVAGQAKEHWIGEGHQVSLEIRTTQLIVLETDPAPPFKGVR